jgi:signal peptidase II
MTSPATSRTGSGLRTYRRFWIVAALVLVLDQGSKLLLTRLLPYGTYGPFPGPGGAEPIVVIPEVFQLVHIGNTGAAWGLLSGHQWILIGIGVAALLVLFFWRHGLEIWRPRFQVVFGLIAGGIVGNLLDRLLRGHVVDFLDVHLPGIPMVGIPAYRWPAFNVADAAIFCGVFLYLFLSFLPLRDQGRTPGGNGAGTGMGS